MSESCWSIFYRLSNFISLEGICFSLSTNDSSDMFVIMDCIIIMDYTYEAYCAYMNSIYLHVYNWPNPYQYS